MSLAYDELIQLNILNYCLTHRFEPNRTTSPVRTPNRSEALTPRSLLTALSSFSLLTTASSTFSLTSFTSVQNRRWPSSSIHLASDGRCSSSRRSTITNSSASPNPTGSIRSLTSPSRMKIPFSAVILSSFTTFITSATNRFPSGISGGEMVSARNFVRVSSSEMRSRVRREETQSARSEEGLGRIIRSSRRREYQRTQEERDHETGSGPSGKEERRRGLRVWRPEALGRREEKRESRRMKGAERRRWWRERRDLRATEGSRVERRREERDDERAAAAGRAPWPNESRAAI
ncbi:hypothetical protein M5K25_012139 [Dendrobium thyrsiflorum]|uniref:Uncharacterized protein n=1 Tax=Dendrobium thyrsiflorum TaxID=117978 RepID=A0ABD0UWT1_DENTH